MSNKRIRRLNDVASPFGYAFAKVTNGGHLKFEGPGGPVFASASPSCHRDEKNFLKDVRRAAALGKQLRRNK
jgi:hypothetical protein